MKAKAPAALPLLILLVASPALADRGERALGFELAGGYPLSGRASLVFQAVEDYADFVVFCASIPDGYFLISFEYFASDDAHIINLSDFIKPYRKLIACIGTVIYFHFFYTHEKAL